MMRRIVRSSLRYRFLVVAAAAAMMMIGLARLPNLAVDVFPEFAPPRVEIQTISIGMSTAEVESLVTVPLEQSLAGLEGLDVLRSKSVPQLSSIELIFKPGTDLLRARQLVAERIAIVTPTLPTWAAPPFMLQPLSATSRVMKIGMSSDELSILDLSKISYWTIRSRLLSVSGVANVAIWGEQLNQLQVQVKPDRLATYGITLDDVMEATSRALDESILRFNNAATIGTGGFVDTANQRLIVEHVPTIRSADSLKAVTIEASDGTQVKLTDIADIVLDHQPLFGDAVINDGPGIMLIVEKFPWANTLDVTRGVEAAIDDLRPGLPNVHIDTTLFRPATFIDVALENLMNALLLGSLLVLLILVFFLFDWRTAVISLVAIPLSLTAAALVLELRGTTINVMVLAGLVISVGVVVDDAIIDVENITRRLRQHRLEGGQGSTALVILDASLEVRGAIIYATLIDIVAIVPIFFIQGLSGAFFQPLVVSYALAVFASLLVALTVTPAMALILLRSTAQRPPSGSPLALVLQGAYESVLARIVRTARPAYVAVAVISVVGVIVGSTLGQSLLPDFKERDFLMHWVTAPGTSHPEEVRISTAACIELRSIPGVRNCGSHIGQALLADEVVGVDFGENWISVDPAVDYAKTLAAIQEVVDGYPGLRRDVQTYLKERIREVLTGSSDAIVVRISGPALEILRAKAVEVEDALRNIPGIIDLHRQLQVEIPQVRVEVDLAKAQEYGIKPGDVRRAASVLLASEEVGDIFIGGAAYDVHVWTTPDVRQNLTDIEKLPIDTARGPVPLGELATVRIAAAPNIISHQGLTRSIDVDANVKGRDLGSVVRDVEAALRTIAFPQETHAELLGEYAERQAAQEKLLLFALAALVGIFLLLQTSFDSTRLALLAFVTLPSALVGGALAASLTGGVLSLGSLVGFFTVLGIAARNGIMLVNHFQHLERYEGVTFGPGLVVQGARERLSPILMTALATGLALIPLAIAGDLPGHEIEHPMAVVILGGLVTSTLLNLFIMPSLYLAFGNGRNRPGATPEAAATGQATAAT